MYVDVVTMGNRFRIARLAKGYTQGDVARLINKCEEYVNKIENGNANPSIEVLGAICHELDISLPYLVSGIEFKEKNYLKREVNETLASLNEDQQRAVIELARTLKKLNKKINKSR